MESYSQNSNKLDFQHETRILNGIWLITALGLVATAGLAWGAKYLEITATKYDSPTMYVAIGLLLVCMYGLSKDINKINAGHRRRNISVFYSLWCDCRCKFSSCTCHYRRVQHCGRDVFNQYAGRFIFNVDPGSHRFIIMMTLTGLAL
ncbi:membrane protein YbhM [Escherichia coli]|uniref:Membrane protein YbhM n=1 Tax=Escherichia coli TaxID=562 RepID=A0A376TKB6_ECOLX|nr:membrane protein YbhM [Escherichia coli]